MMLSLVIYFLTLIHYNTAHFRNHYPNRSGTFYRCDLIFRLVYCVLMIDLLFFYF